MLSDSCYLIMIDAIQMGVVVSVAGWDREGSRRGGEKGGSRSSA